MPFVVNIPFIFASNFSSLYRRTHMQDLQEVTQEVHYENYRSERLAKGVKKNVVNNKDEEPAPLIITDKDRILQEKEAELKRMHEMLAQMQAKYQSQK